MQVPFIWSIQYSLEHGWCKKRLYFHRVRVPYLQLREATILAQSLYRGLVVQRLVPQLKKEKQQRDVSKTVNEGMKHRLIFTYLSCSNKERNRLVGRKKELLQHWSFLMLRWDIVYDMRMYTAIFYKYHAGLWVCWSGADVWTWYHTISCWTAEESIWWKRANEIKTLYFSQRNQIIWPSYNGE